MSKKSWPNLYSNFLGRIKVQMRELNIIWRKKSPFWHKGRGMAFAYILQRFEHPVPDVHTGSTIFK